MLAFEQYIGGAVAQLGARLDGIEEVVGSNPISSTKIRRILLPSILEFAGAKPSLAHIRGVGKSEKE